MWTQAMYLGKRRVKREAWTDEEGTIQPGYTGWQYAFYCAEWTDDQLNELGVTRWDTRKDPEEEDMRTEKEKEIDEIVKGLVPGQMAQVQVRESFGSKVNYTCKFMKRIKE